MGKPLAAVAMSDQHRATPKQWAIQEKWVDDDDDSACIIELRDRVEALEAQQRREDKLDRLIALDAADPNWEPDPAIAELRAASAEARPTVKDSLTDAEGLVKRVAKSLGAASGLPSGNWDHCADASIREVAAWLDTKGQHGCSLWLREEADRG